MVAQMTNFANDNDIPSMDKKKITDSIKVVNEYIENLSEDEVPFTHEITNKLIMSIVNVNGITDRKFITSYVMNMNVRDSSALRKYITEHEPGIDFNIEVERPESLGGGSVKMFLTLDQFIFSISLDKYEMDFWDEIWGCVKYIELPYDVVWNMPVYIRKLWIAKHNRENSPNNNNQNNEGLDVVNSATINSYAALEQRKQANLGTN